MECKLATIPSNELYVMLGDFNARVGPRERVGKLWGEARGPHGYGERNDAGQELLAFLSKVWSCINFVIMWQKDRRKCLEVAVMRGTECYADHQLLCVKLRVTGICLHHKPLARLKRFDVAKLTRSNDEAFVNTYREAHQEEVVVGAQTRTA